MHEITGCILVGLADLVSSRIHRYRASPASLILWYHLYHGTNSTVVSAVAAQRYRPLFKKADWEFTLGFCGGKDTTYLGGGYES
ncbi:hypothetical protein GJ744_001396 [Endocarpon pusillum]|uniref:Uncharacterized protein n=1 Tax=Endocarpon pusillum TaxID=364733 RepID=A0A8H7ASP9_9EURO|nr:hypothetical protein GJ744_001396 [Endocarpon pusillum]